MNTKAALLRAGYARGTAWCELNAIAPPRLEVVPRYAWRVNACAYWREQTIFICLELCAAPGRAGRAWSWPGYATDRTPYGVVAHELGHHVDHGASAQRGSYYGDFSRDLRAATRELPLTSYCPDDGEWFAEIFRLFVTNPDLCAHLRPQTYAALIERWKPPAPHRGWRQALEDLGAPERHLTAAQRKVEAATPKQTRLL